MTGQVVVKRLLVGLAVRGAALGAIVWLLGELPLTAQAQQTIFNVPSADVTPKGQLFLQHESQFRTWRPGRFLINTTYMAVGVGRHTELDATLFNVAAPASNNISLGLGFKTALPLFARKLKDREIKLTVGSEIPVSLQGQGVGNWTYAHLSARVPRLHTRLTGGVTAGTRQIFGRDTVGAIAGIEQPVTRRVNLIADWYSGSHGLGLLTAGGNIVLPKSVNLYLGYQIPNTPESGRQGFVIEVSKLFF